MRPIPTKLRNQMATDPFYGVCCMHTARLIFPNVGLCEGVIEWHHVWIYGGRQINEKWAILPACQTHHGLVNSDREVREAFQYVSLMMANDDDFKKYPKKDWKQLKKALFSRK